MVEINNQRSVPRYAGVVGGTTTDVRKPEIMVMTSLRRRAIYWLLRSPSQTAKPKTQINRRRTLSFFPVGVDAYRKQLGLKDFSPKSQDAVALQQIKWAWRFTYDWSWWYPSGNRPLQQYLGSLPGAGYGQFGAYSQPDCKIQRSGRNGQRDWCKRAESPRLSPPVYLHHRLPVMGC